MEGSFRVMKDLLEHSRGILEGSSALLYGHTNPECKSYNFEQHLSS